MPYGPGTYGNKRGRPPAKKATGRGIKGRPTKKSIPIKKKPKK
jgi:hypothetical protein